MALSTLEPMTLMFVAALFGLLVGSFLNVVILRLPVMLERQWQQDAQWFLQETTANPDDARTGSPAPSFAGAEVADAAPEPFNLVTPRSRCPGCERPVRAFENVPIISYLLLRGRCPGCGMRISPLYPVSEAAVALLFALAAWHFGPSPDLLAALVFISMLYAGAVIDARTTLLPDQITLPLLWLGLAWNTTIWGWVPIADAVWGAIAGYASLWLVFHAFRLTTGKEGMGYGDFKLFAALGAWLGWQLLPLILLGASLVGALVGIALLVARRQGRSTPIPFGPFLAAAALIALVTGEAWLDWFLPGTPMAGLT